MSILNRQEREKLVLDLYNQGKTIREIAKEVRMSFRDIGVILKKTFPEKAEGLKEQQEELQQLSVSTQAYKLFSEGKRPVEVAIALNLRARGNQIVDRILETKTTASALFNIQRGKR